jgi:diaminopimelate decarboxylase
LKIISEPGRFFVEGSHVLFTQICARRWVNAEGMPVVEGSNHHGEKKRAVYVVGEGCTGCFKDALLCGESFEPHPFALHKDRDDKSANCGTDGVMYESLVVGPSGEAWDRIAGHRIPLLLPLLRPGDWLFFTRAGAYSVSIASANSHVHADPRRAYTYIATTYDLPKENSM